MKLTIKDIAQRCQVGKSTVSRVLNNDPKVNAQTREKVQRVIDELGFQPNRTARAMRGSTEPVVGIILSRLNSQAESQTLSAILEQLYHHHITPIIVESQFKPDLVAHHLHLFQRRQVDAVIVFGFSTLPTATLSAWKGTLVVIARRYDEFSCVYYDDKHAMHALLEKLHLRGHRQIAYLGVNDSDETTGRLRTQAYRDFCLTHQINPNFTQAQLDSESAYRHCHRLFEQPVSALLCAGNTLATGALKYLHETQKKLTLAYIGQNKLLQYLAPDVLSLDFGYVLAGKWAVELLLNQLSGDGRIEQRQVPFHLIE